MPQKILPSPPPHHYVKKKNTKVHFAYSHKPNETPLIFLSFPLSFPLIHLFISHSYYFQLQKKST